MAIDFKSVQDRVKDQGVKVLVYGNPGVGKTVLSSTTGAKTLFIDAEAGTMSIRHAKNIQVFTVTPEEPLKQIFPVLEYLRTDNSEKFEWVVIDSISEISEYVLAEERLKVKDDRQAYGELSKRVLPFVKAFRSLELNVVVTAKQGEEKDDNTGGFRHGPDAPGKKIKHELSYLFDIVMPLRIIKNDKGELERWLQTSGDQAWIAKDRSDKLDRWEQPNLEAIRAKIAGKPSNSKPAAVKAA
jgi:phage nucleotide-binding protein